MPNKTNVSPRRQQRFIFLLYRRLAHVGGNVRNPVPALPPELVLLTPRSRALDLRLRQGRGFYRSRAEVTLRLVRRRGSSSHGLHRQRRFRAKLFPRGGCRGLRGSDTSAVAGRRGHANFEGRRGRTPQMVAGASPFRVPLWSSYHRRGLLHPGVVGRDLGAARDELAASRARGLGHCGGASDVR